MIRAVILYTFAWRLRRARKLFARGQWREADRVLAILQRKHCKP